MIVRTSAPEQAATEGGLSLTVIILTYNEELHIERCISNARPLAQRVIVVDSFSKDRTVEIARELGAEVVQRAFKNHADQFQWALDTIPISSDWVLRLDADEYLEPALIAEMKQRLPVLPLTTTGVNLKRKFFFRGRWIRRGGYYPTVLLRLFRRGAARIEQRWMDEHMVLTHGSAETFANDFADHNLNDITWWVDKHNGYAVRQMVDFLNLEYGIFPADLKPARSQNSHAKLKRYLRNRVFGRAPLYLRSVLYFLQRYIFRLGFLDGRQGFVFHVMHGLWYFLLIDAKIEDGRALIAREGVEGFKAWLLKRHGIDVSAT
ncbi:MAG: glycosyltransferase family 2 protein [Rhodomicrobium sp.]